MRHRNHGRKFNRSTAHREALFTNMAISLIEHGRIKTTDQKAKELRRFVERLVTLGKKQSLAARRQAFGTLRNEPAVAKLFGELAERFKTRDGKPWNGGYTRIMKIGHRHGDAAAMSFIELVGHEPGKVAEEPEEAKS